MYVVYKVLSTQEQSPHLRLFSFFYILQWLPQYATRAREGAPQFQHRPSSLAHPSQPLSLLPSTVHHNSKARKPYKKTQVLTCNMVHDVTLMILRHVDDGVGGGEVLASRNTRILMLPWWRCIDDGVGIGEVLTFRVAPWGCYVWWWSRGWGRKRKRSV